jgi:hypothetical protein
MTSDPLLFRYLLGELSAADEATLDERAFVDDAWDAERAMAADDLIDAYLGGGLTSDQRQRFETRFLASSEHRKRFRLLRDLRTVVDRGRRVPAGAHAVRDRRWLVWALAAVLVAALAALVLRLQGPAPQEPRLADGPTPTSVLTPTPSASPSVPATNPMAFVSLPEQPRPVHISVAPAVRVVRFTIPVAEHGSRTYVASVRRKGRTVWEEGDLEAGSRDGRLVVDVPAELMGEAADLALEPDTTRGSTPGPGAARLWSLRIVRP